ncbi:MAG: bifunctional phosphoribosylaminoimidazolecarboxamide formyltransferase/IMP cyclohydrolase [Actinobacteria bacterium]|nr:bifunctional phosphoribosylaminoimidazolecarboxamide formyltransferase/IMP cyclohydrolase [Actinomycetota bacterium]
MKIKRALISVSDKTGVEDLARGLVEQGVTLISSGGTARTLSRAGIPVTPVSELTGAPEMLDGRVKTLHPKIHGGILADRRKPQHLAQLKEHGISPIDLVVCNLYPFAQTVANDDVTEDEAVEQIDIGGPAMVRAAAKNYKSVAVVVNPDRYEGILNEMRSRAGALSDETRARLAAEAFAHTATYDMAVSRWMTNSDRFPERLFLGLERLMPLRYGENPHQQGALYASSDPGWRQVAGKELSFTNILDFDAAWRLACEFALPAVAIIKHTNPCGVATGDNIEDAYRRAVECDPRSAFGGIVAANREIDGMTAEKMLELIAVTDIVIAPGYSRDAVSVFSKKKNLRLIEALPFTSTLDIRSAAGGLLVQDLDTAAGRREEMVVAGKVQPTEEDWDDLLFAWTVVKHVKSNSVVFATDGQAFGIGAGQMSRVEAVELAARRAGDKTKNSVCATDGFFPFRDGVDAAVDAGARAIIHPGGSVRDAEVTAAADEHGIPMVLTGRRHFRH